MTHDAAKSIVLEPVVLGPRPSVPARRSQPCFQRSREVTDSVYEFTWTRFWLFAAGYVAVMIVIGITFLGTAAGLLWLLARLAGH